MFATDLPARQAELDHKPVGPESLHQRQACVLHLDYSKEQHGNIFYVSIKIADQPCNTAAAHST